MLESLKKEDAVLANWETSGKTRNATRTITEVRTRKGVKIYVKNDKKRKVYLKWTHMRQVELCTGLLLQVTLPAKHKCCSPL